MVRKHILEKLADVNPDAEIWWDSSPLIYESWSESMVKNAPVDRAEKVKEQLNRFYDPRNTKTTIFRGVTTNPPLSLDVMKALPDFCNELIDGIVDKNPGIDKETLFLMVYKEIIQRGAKMFLEVFERSNYKYGYISGQLDPRLITDVEKMVSMAEELSALSPNVMIKVPGTKEGYEVVKILTSKGISTNNTLSFVIPQFITCANAVREGIAIAKKNGVDLTRWRSIITAMSTRYGTLGNLKKEAEDRGIELSEGDIRLAEIAIFKKAYHLIKERGYPSKMLLCSIRVSPIINGEKHIWHLEKIAGANIVYTCPPKFIAQLFEMPDDFELRSQIDEPIPESVMEKLMRIPYFEKGFMEDGLTPEKFNTHPALVATANEHCESTQEMINFVDQRLRKAMGK